MWNTEFDEQLDEAARRLWGSTGRPTHCERFPPTEYCLPPDLTIIKLHPDANGEWVAYPTQAPQ